MTETVKVGRNEPCPCGSGKKYKRCCGVNAAPKLSVASSMPAMSETSKDAFKGALNGAPHIPGMDPSALDKMDPQYMMQVTQALQRLPKGQLQRLQAIMQKAMSGRDVTSEAQEFERTLPQEFQSLIRSFQMPSLENTDSSQILSASQSASDVMTSTSEMTEEKARALIAQAAAEGTISSEQAQALLSSEGKTQPAGLSKEEPGTDKASKLGKFWRNLSGKKNL